MSGKEDEGVFTPHPGDPWHPDFGKTEEEPAEIAEEGITEVEAEEPATADHDEPEFDEQRDLEAMADAVSEEAVELSAAWRELAEPVVDVDEWADSAAGEAAEEAVREDEVAEEEAVVVEEEAVVAEPVSTVGDEGLVGPDVEPVAAEPVEEEVPESALLDALDTIEEPILEPGERVEKRRRWWRRRGRERRVPTPEADTWEEPWEEEIVASIDAPDVPAPEIATPIQPDVDIDEWADLAGGEAAEEEAVVVEEEAVVAEPVSTVGDEGLVGPDVEPVAAEPVEEEVPESALLDALDTIEEPILEPGERVEKRRRWWRRRGRERRVPTPEADTWEEPWEEEIVASIDAPDVPASEIAAPPVEPVEPDVAASDAVEPHQQAAADYELTAEPNGDAVEQPSTGEAEPDEFTEEHYVQAATMEHVDLAEAVARASAEEAEMQALTAPMPGLETAVVGFEDVEDLATDETPAIAPAPSDLGLRVLTGLVFAALFVGSLWVGRDLLAAFIGLVAIFALGEFYSTLRRRGYRPLALFGYLGGAGVLVGTWSLGLGAVPGALLITAIVTFFFYALVPDRRDPLTNAGLTLLGLAWIPALAAFALPIVDSPDFRALILSVVAATAAMDIGSYFAGRSWGRHALAPNLSPNKTIEGLIGGVITGVGIGVLLGYSIDPLDLRAGAALGLVVVVMAPIGDIVESMVKRGLGVKDMGTILPGHGGILDRIDALLLVIPAAWLLFRWLGYLA
ncbi:MAG: phosphatidate cytidylyltransferase [Acidimicrobiia bacterium]